VSVESLAVVLHHSRAKGADKLVMLGIANHDGDGGSWPSVATLARYANIDPRSVNRSIKKLVELGEVKRAIGGGGTRLTPDHTRPNLYTITLDCPPECDRSRQHKITRRPVDNSPKKGVTPTSGGDAHVRGGVTPTSGGGVTPTSPEPPIEPSMKIGLGFGSTSPGRPGVCWSCGKPGSAPPGARYCSECASNGLATEWIPCVGCGNVRKRRYPGESSWNCGCNGTDVENTG
jgi:hypothetical protein